VTITIAIITQAVLSKQTLKYKAGSLDRGGMWTDLCRKWIDQCFVLKRDWPAGENAIDARCELRPATIVGGVVASYCPGRRAATGEEVQ